MFVNSRSLLLLASCIGYLSAQDIIVQIPDGRIKGRVETTITNTTFYSFQGIPYAKPPLGELRFQAPQPVEPWQEVLDVTFEKNICYQVTNDRPDESEHCLFVNVFSPRDVPEGSLLPVMVFIYGGGFVEGSSESVNYGPQHLMEYGVVLVTFNYRVGPFGFASTGDSAIPGNAGLKDQNMALQWVQKNIQYFSGDPDKVTIFGESAGGASVTYQVISPTSKGLFRAAIAESGSALSSWAFQRNQKEITYQTASYLNPAFADGKGTTQELLEYLLSVPAADLDKASYTMALTETTEYIQIQQGFFWAPVIEHEHEGAFITKGMYEYLKTGDINKVPLIIGFNSEEALFFTDDVEGMDDKVKAFEAQPKLLTPLDMHIPDINDEVKAGEEIKEIYVPDSSFISNPAKLVTYFSDQCFIRSVVKHAELQSAFTDVYLYEFAYSGLLGGHVSEPVIGFSDSVRHGEDLGYLFRRNYGGYNTTDLSQYPESDRIVFKNFITMFTNFAKTLNPTPEEVGGIIWPTVDATDVPYLAIGSYSEIRNHPKESAFKTWDTIYDKYGIPPYDTY